jgi:hypothetical protein
VWDGLIYSEIQVPVTFLSIVGITHFTQFLNRLLLQHERQCTVRTSKRCCSGKAIRITYKYSECVYLYPFVPSIQGAWTMSSVTCLPPHLSTISHKRHNFRNFIEHKICISIFSTTFVWNIFHSKRNWAKYDRNVYLSSCKITLFLSYFNRLMPNGHYSGRNSGRTAPLTSRRCILNINSTNILTEHFKHAA